ASPSASPKPPPASTRPSSGRRDDGVSFAVSASDAPAPQSSSRRRARAKRASGTRPGPSPPRRLLSGAGGRDEASCRSPILGPRPAVARPRSVLTRRATGEEGGPMADQAIRRALISVSDKTGLIELARALASRGVEVLSTGGTAKALKEAGLAVTDIADHT